jgi:uncharacterized membrane protein YfcA
MSGKILRCILDYAIGAMAFFGFAVGLAIVCLSPHPFFWGTFYLALPLAIIVFAVRRRPELPRDRDGMSDEPQRSRPNWRFMTLAAVAAYFGAYYATYTMPRGIRFGTDPHYHYAIGSWVLPDEASTVFAPAHWVDMQTLRRGQGD